VGAYDPDAVYHWPVTQREAAYLRDLLTSEDGGEAEYVPGVGHRHADGDIDICYKLLSDLTAIPGPPGG
jgi:hypothetical protein